jgi:metal-dependent amidase/aminoacylase/carboxypeptidase family protein
VRLCGRRYGDLNAADDRADGDAILNERSGAAEDVSVLLAQVPGLYFNLGIVPRSQDIAKPRMREGVRCFVTPVADSPRLSGPTSPSNLAAFGVLIAK